MKYQIDISSDIFPGFYETDFSPERIERFDDEDNVEELSAKEYQDIKDRICQCIADLVDESTEFTVNKWKLDSPQWYNYRNDILILEIETTSEEILYEFFSCDEYFELLQYINFPDYQNNKYHEVLLQELVSYKLFDYEENIREQLY